MDDNEYMPSASHANQNSRLGYKMHIASYLQTEGNGTGGGSAPFRCPNSELGTGYTNQEAGIAYNINFGDDKI